MDNHRCRTWVADGDQADNHIGGPTILRQCLFTIGDRHQLIAIGGKTAEGVALRRMRCAI